MSNFTEFVNSIKNGWLIGKEVDMIYGYSKCGQQFAILITSGIWYAVRVIMDEDYRNASRPLDLAPPSQWIKYSEHLTKKGAYNEARKWQDMLENGKFVDAYKELSPNQAKERMKVMPKDCAIHPDEYLKPGDMIQSNFWIANHEGIYIGNGDVIHMSGHGDDKCEARARIGKLHPNFIEKTTDNIRVKVFPIRFRTPEDIVNTAKEYARGEFRRGEYHLLLKNCQHFATLCAIGTEQCGDYKTIWYALGNLLVGVAFAII